MKYPGYGLSRGRVFGRILGVFHWKKPKSHQRFYLLPGQGGRNYYRKQRIFIRWAIVVAVGFGAIMGLIMWQLAHQKPG